MCIVRYTYWSFEEYYGSIEKNKIETYIHIDLIKGMSHDEFACEYLIQHYHPKGIVSTKTKVINKAKALNTTTVFRVFILDSQALSRSIDLIKRVEPDYVEVLPGVATKAIQIINEETNTQVIAGGLINDVDEVNVAVGAVLNILQRVIEIYGSYRYIKKLYKN